MSEYYNSQRTRNLFNPSSTEPYKLSRSKLELFIDCPRCFYLDRRLGVGRPPGYPFALNSAVDHLLKKEFDIQRAKNLSHPLIEKYGLKLKPVSHEKLEIWRENFKGIELLHPSTRLLITGAIDDLWMNEDGEYVVVDYKSTSKAEEINALDKEWQDGYKRQMEIYQWLLRGNGLKVSNTGYFVYCNGRTDREAFDGKLEFEITLIPYAGNDSWVDQAVVDAKNCLMLDSIPDCSENCDYCAYVQAVGDQEKGYPEGQP